MRSPIECFLTAENYNVAATLNRCAKASAELRLQASLWHARGSADAKVASDRHERINDASLWN